MFRNLNFRSWFTFLNRNKLYTAINFFGLSIALAMIVLISTYTIRQLSTDAFQQKADRILLVTNGTAGNSAYYLQKYLLDRYPEIESTTAIEIEKQDVIVGNNRDKFNVEVLHADSTFFDIFTVPFVEGDKELFRAERRNVIVSEAFARKLVGGAAAMSVIGQPILLNEQKKEPVDYVIAGIMRGIDNSVLPACDLVVRAERLTDINMSNDSYMSNAGAVQTFLLAREQADLKAREADMLAYFKEIYWPYKYGHFDRIELMPLRDCYFSNIVSNDLNRGNRDFVLILFSVAFVLLLFAVINYVNLTMAQTGMRAKEMATRRLLGASKGEVFAKLIFESVTFTALSFLLGLVIADLATPLACRLLDYEFTIWSAMSPLYVAGCLASIVAIGILSGLLPALAIAAFKPIDVMKGSFRSRTKMLYSRIFIAFQHTITVMMLVAALTIRLQIRHLVSMPLGYETEDILVVDNDMFRSRSEVVRFVDELKKLPCVEAVGVGNGTPLSGTNNNTFRTVSFQQIVGDSAYFRILGLRVKQDNRLAEAAWFFNEYAFRQLETDESAPELRIDEKNNFPVGGIYYDFRLFHSMREQSAAMIYNCGEWDFEKKFPWNTIVKTQGSHAAAVASIREMLKTTHPEVIWNDGNRYLTDEIARLYADQDRLMKIVAIFTLLAVIVSALGLLAISTYYILQRRQEIAVRKVFGSQHGQIVRRLVGSFLRMVAVGAVIAVPFAGWCMQRWLDGYSYRIDLSWWIFAAAIGAVLLFAFLTVLWQSIRAALENPIRSIKD